LLESRAGAGDAPGLGERDVKEKADW